jgi:hypothetical protein
MILGWYPGRIDKAIADTNQFSLVIGDVEHDIEPSHLRRYQPIYLNETVEVWLTSATIENNNRGTHDDEYDSESEEEEDDDGIFVSARAVRINTPTEISTKTILNGNEVLVTVHFSNIRRECNGTQGKAQNKIVLVA